MARAPIPLSDSAPGGPDQVPRPPLAPPAWVPAYFGDAYRLLYRRLVDHDGNLRAAADWIAATLAWAPGDWVLDLACGYGRHLRHLVRRPARWMGLDLLAAQLREARRDLPAGAVAWVQGDMAHLPLRPGALAAVLLLFNSFGYRAEDDGAGDAPERHLLGEIARALRPGGRALLEVPNRDGIRRAVAEQPRMVTEGEGLRLVDEWRLDRGGEVLHGLSIFEHPGGAEEHRFTVRLHSLTSLSALARAAGLRPVRAFGGLTGRPFRAALSEQLVLLLERR